LVTKGRCSQHLRGGGKRHIMKDRPTRTERFGTYFPVESETWLEVPETWLDRGRICPDRNRTNGSEEPEGTGDRMQDPEMDQGPY